MESTTKVKLITKGKSFSFEKISVIKNPMDCNKEAWHKDDKAAINKNGQTDLSLYESLQELHQPFLLEQYVLEM